MSRTGHGDRTVRVLLASGNAVFRRVVGKWLNAQRGLTLTTTAADVREAVSLVRAMAVDLAVMEMELPGGGGLRAAGAIDRATGGRTRTLVFGQCDKPEQIRAAQRAGVWALVPGYCDLAQLRQVICAAMRASAPVQGVWPLPRHRRTK